jgi:cell division protein FtsW
VLIGAVAALVAVGLVMVYSASFVVARTGPQPGDDAYYLGRQAVGAGLGALGLIVAARVDYHCWRRLALPALSMVVLLLLAVAFSRLGQTAYGAQRWLSLGPLPAIQPSEFAKLALVLYYASWLSDRQGKLGRVRSGPLPFAAVLMVVGGLVMVQPDFGSALVLVAIAAALFFVGGGALTHFAGGALIGGAALAFFASSASYRSQRLAAYVSAGIDPLGIGWQVRQAGIALGTGGLLGVGLGASRQKFYYLYGAHTDSIFAVVGEELGIIGTVGVLALFGVVIWRGLRIARRAPDAFGGLLAVGVTIWIGFQAFLNVAVITGLLPFTGVPLPFVSYGGSSLVAALGGIGLLLNVARQSSVANRTSAAKPSFAKGGDA